MTQVRVDQVTKKFGNVVAVDDISIDFKDGQLTVLVGPSGCGKTTLLRMIAGLEDVSAGSIYIGDRLVNDVPAWHRNTAMVFQNYALYPHMSVFDNMAYPLRARRVPAREIKERVEKTAAALGIRELLGRKPRELSGGQMQRVAVGRAIVRTPDAFLMDEPLSNLDAKLRVEMRAELKRLQKDLGVTTIYVTHDQAEAMTMADRLIVMRNGHIQQAGTPEDLYLRPRNMFVAGFIGSPSMNFLDCRFLPSEGALVGPTFRHGLPDWLRKRVDRGQAAELVLGVRPEDLSVSTRPLDGSIPGKMYMVEPLGRENLLTVGVSDAMIKTLAAPEIRVELDQPVWLGLNNNRVHIFDRKTEESLLLREAET
jgi:multiple sugar transport system ATP-binding protein